MTRKKKLMIALCVLTGALLVAGITAIATTNYGSQSDPLITLSYLNQTAKPSIKDELDASIEQAKTELAGSLNAQISDFTREIDAKIASAGDGALPAGEKTFTVVTLKHRQVIKCGAGTEILIRSGSATAYGGTSPRLIDTTGGTEITAAGAALKKNHMYMVTIAENGLRAASDSVTLLIRGEYTVYSDL
jgi:hypothetical protein